MYLIVTKDFAVVVRDLQRLLRVLEEVFGGEVKVSVAPGGYVLQARQPEKLKAEPVVANLGKQRSAAFIPFPTLPTLPFRVPTVGFDE
jgi:DNA-binding transcriptional MocR family regulator